MNQELKLSGFLTLIQDEIKSSFSETYSVVAEIASMSGSRHMYFELIEKEGGKIKAKCRANLWAFNRFRVIGHFENITRETLKTGMKVLFRVQAEFHVQYGFSLTIVDIDPSYSLGEFERIKQETITHLKNEGLLDLNKEQELPNVLNRLAILTSETAAGYQDFMEQLHNNAYSYVFNTVLFPCIVQGENAPSSILNALDLVEKDKPGFDAIILIRGGGSVIDLSCFDNYELNFNLSQSSYPVITGIGHDRDVSVADLVAHTQLKTPTAVAEFIVERNSYFEQALIEVGDEIFALVKSTIQTHRDFLTRASSELRLQTQSIFYNEKENLKQKVLQLKECAFRNLRQEDKNIGKKENALLNAAGNYVNAKKMQIDRMAIELEMLNPETQFKRGYTLTLKNGFPVSKENLEKGDEIETRGKNIRIISTVKEIE